MYSLNKKILYGQKHEKPKNQRVEGWLDLLTITPQTHWGSLCFPFLPTVCTLPPKNATGVPRKQTLRLPHGTSRLHYLPTSRKEKNRYHDGGNRPDIWNRVVPFIQWRSRSLCSDPGDSLPGSWLFPCPVTAINGQVPQLLPKKAVVGFPWWLSGKESTCQCRRHGFDSWSRKIPHAVEQLSPCTTTTELVL